MEGDLGDIVVRRAEAADAQAIAAVHLASWREAYAGVLPQKYLATLDVAERKKQWDHILASEGTRTWIAATPERLYGFASLGDSRDEDSTRGDLELYAIYVDPVAWGHGVARDLIRTLLDEVPSRTTVSLWVLADNARAQHFYRRHGFWPDGVERREEIGGTDVTEVRYRRD